MTGSMLIPNDQGTKTLLVLTEHEATPIESVQIARARLKKEKASPSIRSGNIKFLTEWLRVAENPQVLKLVSQIPPSQVPSSQSSFKSLAEILEECRMKSLLLEKQGEK